jgi:hypothetical protein
MLAQGELLGSNLFAYCVNNPVMNIDLSGLWAISISTFWSGVALDFFITVFYRISLLLSKQRN